MSIKKWILPLFLGVFSVTAFAGDHVRHHDVSNLSIAPPRLELEGKLVRLDRSANRMTIDRTTYGIPDDLLVWTEIWGEKYRDVQRVASSDLSQDMVGKRVRYETDGKNITNMVIDMTTRRNGR